MRRLKFGKYTFEILLLNSYLYLNPSNRKDFETGNGDKHYLFSS